MVDAPRPDHLWDDTYAVGGVSLAQNAEIERFMLGSTVVLLFARHWRSAASGRLLATAVWAKKWARGYKTRLS